MMKNIFDAHSKQEIENIIGKLFKLMESKKSEKEIIEKSNIEFIDELLKIAQARKRSEESKSKFIDLLYFNKDDLRFSTPKKIADYRANRLKCNKIVDLCSGIGSQAISFLKTCNCVLAVELDERKVEYGKANDPSKKISFLCGDALSKEIIEKVKSYSPDIIFCDPERMEEEKIRTIESIKPDIRKIIGEYSKITSNICIELPPQMNPENLISLGNFEAEYLSYPKKLNRLNLYFGKLKNCSVSVADVSGNRIEKGSTEYLKTADKPSKYIYEASTAIIKAGLENEFAKITGTKILSKEKNRLLFTSQHLSKTKESSAFSEIYRVVGHSDNFREIIKILKKNKFGKVILKKNTMPKDYWPERKKYEKLLSGKKQACLFSVKLKSKEVEIIAEKDISNEHPYKTN